MLSPKTNFTTTTKAMDSQGRILGFLAYKHRVSKVRNTANLYDVLGIEDISPLCVSRYAARSWVKDTQVNEMLGKVSARG